MPLSLKVKIAVVLCYARHRDAELGINSGLSFRPADKAMAINKSAPIGPSPALDVISVLGRASSATTDLVVMLILGYTFDSTTLCSGSS